MATTVYSDIDLSFTKHPITGDIAKKVNERAIVQSLKTLLLTNHYERPFRPLLGSGVRALLFEQVHPSNATLLKKEIQTLIQNYEPRVGVDDVVVNAKPDDNAYEITVRFFIFNKSEPVTLSFYLERIR
jgi:phage baseplate assembly protein W